MQNSRRRTRRTVAEPFNRFTIQHHVPLSSPILTYSITGHTFLRETFRSGGLPRNYVKDQSNLDALGKLTEFVSVSEVKAAVLAWKTALGLDGLTVREVRKRIPLRALAKLFTLWSRMRWVPQYFLDSRTCFIPKRQNTCFSAELRPISIASVLLRHFHKVLNTRLVKCLQFSPLQFGFQPLEGIARAVEMLESVFAHFKSKHNPFAAAFIDLCKAFDSVSLKQFLKHLKLSESLTPSSNIYVTYIRTQGHSSLLRGSTQKLCIRGEESGRATPSLHHYFSWCLTLCCDP